MLHSFALCAASLGLEAAFGYPSGLFRLIGHPVTWVGAVLSALDHRLNRSAWDDRWRTAMGLFSLATVLVLFVGGAQLLHLALMEIASRPLAFGLEALVASSLLAQRSLAEHVWDVAKSLRTKDLAAAQNAVAKIVGRDTDILDREGVTKAALESLAENFSDGIVAPAFYLALFGLPGCLFYKVVNTADSMIGHRTPRYRAFGWGAARLDDVMNWPVARLAALLLAAAAWLSPSCDGRAAWRIARRDSGGHASPNAGWPEAALAGALGIEIGGPRTYQGATTEDARIGDRRQPIVTETIDRALALYWTACALQFLGYLALALLMTG